MLIFALKVNQQEPIMINKKEMYFLTIKNNHKAKTKIIKIKVLLCKTRKTKINNNNQNLF